jgi:hypothetical protein
MDACNVGGTDCGLSFRRSEKDGFRFKRLCDFRVLSAASLIHTCSF